jgi:hypothetical protein
VYGLVKAVYVEPDQPPQRQLHGGGIGVIRVASFTFRDQGKINVVGASVTGASCLVSVNYTQGSGGRSF